MIVDYLLFIIKVQNFLIELYLRSKVKQIYLNVIA